MNKDQIKEMFEGLSEITKNVLARNLQHQLTPAIKMLRAEKSYVPSAGQILHAFRLCPLETTRVCLIGQDPYTAPGVAMGLSFGVAANKSVPPSLRNIYKCLVATGLMSQIPPNGDLSKWAMQGVLLLNAALTTAPNVSEVHMDAWKPFTTAVIKYLAGTVNPTFILLGNFAQEFETDILEANSAARIFKWGHPSPMNKANNSPGPKNFINCDCFTKVTALVGINWELNEPIALQKIPAKEIPIVVFTDGAAIKNGKPECVSSWAFAVFNVGIANAMDCMISQSNLVEGSHSNNRGEITAIFKALQWLTVQVNGGATFENIVIISDSLYSINCIETWCVKWRAKNQIQKNLDLIYPARDLYDELRAKGSKITFRHVNSHCAEPPHKDQSNPLSAWFIWYGNDLVDKLAQNVIEKNVQK